jgi:hypothetical protein
MASQHHPGFLRLLRNPVSFRLYLLSRLPSAFFAGLRIDEADEVGCSVSVPFKWFTRNPFRSTYFACLSMAAEMSTGILAMAAVYGRKPAVSMLVVGISASFHKKATGRTVFVCVDGPAIKEAVAACVATGEARQVKARSVGTNSNGEIVAEFFITWSFKAKTPSL